MKSLQNKINLQIRKNPPLVFNTSECIFLLPSAQFKKKPFKFEIFRVVHAKAGQLFCDTSTYMSELSILCEYKGEHNMAKEMGHKRYA